MKKRTHGTLVFVEEAAAWSLTATPDVMMAAKRVFPRANKHRTADITLTHTTVVARDLEWFMVRYPLTMSGPDRKLLKRAAAAQRDREETVTAILTGDRSHMDGLVDPVREPRDYQLTAADLALTNDVLLLGDEVGLGKTMSGLLVLRDPARLPALVVCPTHLPHQWEDEISKTLPWLRVHIIRTGQPYDPRRRREMKGYDPDVLIVNYHKLTGWVDHLAGQVKSVIFDEAQELRRSESFKYKAAGRIADGATTRVGLTATPIYNYAGEIHNLLEVLAPGVLGSREEFGREWAGGGWSDKMRVTDPQALGTYLRDQGLFLRRTRKDVGRELPDVLPVPHTVDADEKVHDQLMEGAIDLAETILHGDHKEAFTAAGDLDWQARHATGVAKAPYVAEFVRLLLESERKVVIFGWHRDVYDIWLDKLDDFNPALYTGSETVPQKRAAVERFLDVTVNGNGDPCDPEDAIDECRVLIISLRSGSGLNGLQNMTKVAVIGELDWSPQVHDQCIGRLNRDLDEDALMLVDPDEPVVAYFLVSRVGADPVMADVLNLKRAQSEAIVDPDAELLQPTEPAGDRVRKLAEDVLAKRERDSGGQTSIADAMQTSEAA